MKSYDWVDTYFEGRRLHDAAVGDAIAGVWSKLLRGLATLAKLARHDSSPRHHLPNGRIA